jgi:hypothetical protein
MLVLDARASIAGMNAHACLWLAQQRDKSVTVCTQHNTYALGVVSSVHPGLLVHAQPCTANLVGHVAIADRIDKG